MVGWKQLSQSSAPEKCSQAVLSGMQQTALQTQVDELQILMAELPHVETAQQPLVVQMQLR